MTAVVRAAAFRVAAVTALLVALLRVAHADNVDTLIGQLDDDSDRVRISAVLALTKLADARAIPGLARRLEKDSVKNVRGLAAKALGAIASGKVSARDKQAAVAALQKAASSDPDEFVKAKASAELASLGSTGPSTPSKGGVYVNIGPMSSKTGGDDPKFRALMKKTASETMGRVASGMQTSWPGRDPSKSDLDKKGVAGFYVDGTLNEVKVEKSGSSSKVSCKVSMLLASYPEKSVFGFLNGGAAVQASASASDVALAQQDCVTAVVEDLIAKKIVPTIKMKAGN
ncbi:MAG TPA: HEAT repeat domain-containing protein [Kofleriaceae bacterium]|nr:HEAT repeat domain-containing protein [Kofleriaceae bacterium]